MTNGLAFDDGLLEVIFAEGVRLSVPSSEGYERWEIVGPHGMRIASVSGGELSIWRSRAQP